MILVPTRFRFNTKCLQWWCLVAFSVAILLPVSSSAAMKQTQDMTQNSPSSSISSSFTSSGRVGNIMNKESYHDQGVPNDVELRHLFERSESPPTSQTKRMSSSSSRLFHIQSPSLLGKHGERRMIAESISCPNPEWSQLGMTISGKATNDHFGNVVRMSADGQVIITCAAQQAFGQGYARVYRRDDSDPLGWVQVGEELNGSVFSSSIAWGAQWGQSCAISADGDVIAISSKALRLVRIYRRDPYAVSGLGWTQVGENIQSSVPNDEFGSFIDMSGNGSVVLISAGEYNKIFQSNADDPIGWSQVGSAIPIQYARSKLSYNGEIVVVSNFISDVVQIFQQNDSVPLGWEQLGDDLEGDEEGDHFGVEMGLSDNGEVLAISAYRANANRGHVKVFKKNSTTQQYEQIGGDIDGDVNNEFFGQSIALSGNSDILSIVQNINTAGSWTGYSYLYKMDPLSGLWAKITTDIQYECHVSSTALSYNGEVLAAGCLRGGTPANQDVGEVNILEVCHELDSFSWDIDLTTPGYLKDPPIQDGVHEFVTEYDISDRDYEIEVFQDDCATPSTGLPLAGTDEFKASGVNSIQAIFMYNQSTIQSSNLWTANSTGGDVNLCIKLSLYTSANESSRILFNFIETTYKIEVDLTTGFSTAVNIFRTEAGVGGLEVINIEENITAYQCNDSFGEIESPPALTQGSFLQICVETEADSVLEVGNIKDMTISQNGTKSFDYVSSYSDSYWAQSSCMAVNTTASKCKVKVQLLAEYFSDADPVDLDIVGTVKLDYLGRRKLLHSATDGGGEITRKTRNLDSVREKNAIFRVNAPLLDGSGTEDTTIDGEGGVSDAPEVKVAEANGVTAFGLLYGSVFTSLVVLVTNGVVNMK